MGKWTALKKKYPKVIDPEDEYQQKVEKLARTKLALSDVALKEEFIRLKRLKENLQDQITTLTLELKAVESVFISRMEARGGEAQIKFEEGITLYLIDEPEFRVGEPENFRQWIDGDSANAAEFPLTVNANTLKSRLKARMEAGQELPPGTEISWVNTKLGARGLKQL